MDRLEKQPFAGLVPGSVLLDRSVVGSRQMRCRRSHGFIIKLQGVTEYRCGQQRWPLRAGEILFVEKGSSYSIREVEPGYSYVVNFECAGDMPHPIFRLPFPQGYDISPLAQKLYLCWQKADLYGALATLYGLLAKTVDVIPYASDREAQLLEPVTAYLSDHLTDPELSSEHLHELVGVSPAYLRRIFKKQYGTGPAGFVIRKRITLARQLLVSGEDYPIATVAAMVGCRDPLYFSRLFKKHLGLSPSEYRSRYRQDPF